MRQFYRVAKKTKNLKIYRKNICVKKNTDTKSYWPLTLLDLVIFLEFYEVSIVKDANTNDP